MDSPNSRGEKGWEGERAYFPFIILKFKDTAGVSVVPVHLEQPS